MNALTPRRMVVVLLALVLVPAGTAIAAPRSGVSGHLQLVGSCPASDAYCGGYAVPATIAIRRAGSARIVRTVHARKGRFHARLRPGRYRLAATADDGNGAGSARVRVRRHRVTVVAIVMHSPSRSPR